MMGDIIASLLQKYIYVTVRFMDLGEIPETFREFVKSLVSLWDFKKSLKFLG